MNNKYTKIGLSALCGSIASISAANAGSMEVTGAAEATFTTLSNQVTGNPVGMATNMTFTGNGELDGGQTFSAAFTNTHKNAYSSANITFNTNSSGTFKLSSAEGGAGIGGYDDNMPTAWEEVWDTGITTRANFQKGVASTTNLSWTSPKIGGTTFQIAYTPDNDGSSNVKKGISGSASDRHGSGWDMVLDAGTEDGTINMFVGGSRTELARSRPQARDLSGDHEEAVIGLKFAFGPVAIGGQVSGERMRTRTVNTAEYYGNTSWGVAFNVNDSLSVSYSEARHLMTKTHKQNQHQPDQLSLTHIVSDHNINEYTPKSWMRGDSIQVAYTIGGMGLKWARTTYDNTLFTFDDKKPKESQIVAVTLAF